MDSENISSDTGVDVDCCTSETANSAIICGLEPDSLVRLVQTAVGLPAEALDRLAGVADKLRAVEGLPQLDSTAD
ncbi:hypothetical protein [Nocardia flavorosea]|uniref:Uncharacterized protein n=1 Tax=Nocardia flavorosea TaxID=53429 RepID=A0A846YCK0_9NOCA|nr:hypothetical protein [Nocardia flavorosea]NKY56597.1 hypothetical protein [Nocardia flavorosea]